MTSRAKKSKSSQSSAKRKRKRGSTSTAPRVREVALAEVKDDLSRYLRLAAKGDIAITRHGKPAGVLIGFESEEDWIDYRLEHDPALLARIASARAAIVAGRGVRLESIAE
jgi:prevent-host-death family protein